MGVNRYLGWGAILIYDLGNPVCFSGSLYDYWPFFVDSLQRKNMFYALTNERAIIISGIFNQTTKSVDIKKLPEINITTLRDGRGTITFGPVQPMSWMYPRGSSSNMNSRYIISPSFDLIDDAKTVYRHIKNLRNEIIS